MLTLHVKRILIIAIVILALPALVSAPRTPTTTTVPPITAQSAGVQLNCFPLQVFPGSVTPGTSGFIRVRCPTTGAVRFGIVGAPTVTLTPTFTLGIGYSNASIISTTDGGNPCSFNFLTMTVMVGNVTVAQGAFLNHAITFGNPPTSSSQLLAGDFDYCLQYQNAASTGLGGFDIVWT